MATKNAVGYEWTSSEMASSQGFFAGPRGAHPEGKKIQSFIVIRIHDEVSSNICKRMEEMSFSSSGLVIHDESAIARGMSPDYYTHLFHRHCRCKLIPKPESFSENIDRLDAQVASSNSSISYNQNMRSDYPVSQELRQSVNYTQSINQSIRNEVLD